MKKEFTGGLIQKDSSMLETGGSEPSHLLAPKPDNKEGIDDSPWLSWLKKVSIGKYRTPMYYKNSDSWSSIIGGVVTLLGLVLIITYTSVTLIPIL